MRALVFCLLVGGFAAACTLRGTDYLTEGGGCPGQLCGEQCVDLMSDPMNCGLCGETCLGECTQGACVIYEDGASTAVMGGIATDESRIYFMATREGTGSVLKMPLEQGTPEVIVTGIAPSSIFVSGTELYVNVVGVPDSFFARFDKTQTFAQLMQTDMSIDFFPTLVFSTAQGVGQTDCWVALDAMANSGIQCQVAGLDPGPVQVIDGSPIDLAMNGAKAYTVNDQNQLWEVDTAANSAPVLLATLSQGLQAIALAQGRAYLATATGISQIELDGSGEMEVTTTPHPAAFEMVIDGNEIYVTDFAMPGRLSLASTDGGPETVLYEAENSRLGGLTVRDEYVYFGSVDEGRMLRRSRFAEPPP